MSHQQLNQVVFIEYFTTVHLINIRLIHHAVIIKTIFCLLKLKQCSK